MEVIKFEGVSKHFANSGQPALSNVSFSVDEGEFVVVLGPSGCGKTTILNLIAGLEKPSSGSISLRGDNAHEIEPKDRDIAMVFQNYALYPHLSVFDNLAFPLKNRHVPKMVILNKVNEVAKLLGVNGLLERKPHQLSGGEKQRIAIGRAMIRNPSIFLFDEPLSNLDVFLRFQLRSEIKKLHLELGSTFIYVTHDQGEAMSLADKLLVLKNGSLQQFDTPLSTYRQPGNEFVATFLGNQKMNIFENVSVDGFISWLSWRDITLSMAKWPGIKELAASVIDIGVRPECFNIVEKDNKLSLPFTHIHADFLGHEVLLHGRIMSTVSSYSDILVLIDTETYNNRKLQGNYHIAVNLQDIHFFDHSSKRRLPWKLLDKNVLT